MRRHRFDCLMLLLCWPGSLMAASGGAEKVLLAGPFRGRHRYYNHTPLLKIYRPWKIDWENYLYKDFYPCVADNHVAARPKGGRPAEKMVYVNEGPRGTGIQAKKLLAIHFGKLPENRRHRAKFYPRKCVETCDWRGYELLRMDVKFSGPVHIWWAIEDQVLQPPVVGNYDPKANVWTTLEIDLEKAVKGRGLELGKMWSMYLWANPSTGQTSEMGNIRLARRGARSNYPVLSDPDASKLPPHPKKEGPPAPDIKPDLTPLAGPRTLVYRSEKPLSFAQPHPGPGFVAVYDARHVLLGVSDVSFRWYGKDGKIRRAEGGGEAVRAEVFVVQTLDGGKTWTGLDGDKDRSWLYLAVRPVSRVIDARGGVFTWNKDGCGNDPGPRHRLTKFSFVGKKGWTYNRKDYVFNEENYHCGTSYDDAVRIPSGRIWAAFSIAHRLFTPQRGLHVKYSDNDGKSWHTWQEGRIAMVPGQLSGGRHHVVPYGRHVGVLWFRRKGEHCWTWFDGEKWSAPQHVHGTYLDSAVSVGEKDVIASMGRYGEKDRSAVPGGGKPGIKRFVGGKWVRELSTRGSPGKLCVSGRSVAAINAIRGGAGFHVRWRSPQGKWTEKPDTIETGPIAASAWRVPRYCPPNLVAVAYVPKGDKKTVKVLLIPNKLFRK